MLVDEQQGEVMPEGITALTKIDTTAKRWESIPQAKESAEYREKPYMILSKNGKIFYEGTIGAVAKKYGKTVKQIDKIIEKMNKLPGGVEYELAYESERPMRKYKPVYYIYEGERLVIHGLHNEVCDELGLGRSQISPKTKTLFKKRYTVVYRKELV
jgi:hypothetical protein